MRRWRARDAEALHRAVIDSIEHLRPWMPWIAEEPLSVAERRALLQRWEQEWDGGGDRVYGMFAGDAVVVDAGCIIVSARARWRSATGCARAAPEWASPPPRRRA